MSRTTTALKRLGVPSLAAVTLVAGLPLFLGTAQAAHITGLTLTQANDQDAAGACIPFTADLNFTSGNNRSETIDVTLTDNNTDITGGQTGAQQNATQDVDFCTLPFGSINPATPQDVQDGGASGTDRAEFVTDANGTVTFGVTSNQPGSVLIRAFYETTDNDTFDAGEFSATATQVFTAGGEDGSNENQNAAQRVEVIENTDPATATVVVNVDEEAVIEGEQRTFRVAVFNGTNPETSDRLQGVTVSFTVDSSTAADQGPAIFGVTDNNGIATGTITFPVRSGTANANDTVTFFVNQSDNTVTNTPGLDANQEPSDTVAVTVVDNTNQLNRTVELVPLADTDQTPSNTSDPAVNTAKDGDRSFRAIVDAAATDANSTDNTLLSFGVTGGSGDETVRSADGTPECSTDPLTTTEDGNDSFCDVVVNDPTPVAGQTLTVVVTIRGTSAADTATLSFVSDPSSARNITVTPDSGETLAGGVREFQARVVDAQGQPVSGVLVTFTENGAGFFRTDPTTFTDANGIARVELSSGSAETGSVTVTGTISAADTQCDERAGQGTNSNGTSVPSTQPAGNCSDTGSTTFVTSFSSPSPTATPASPTATPASPGATTPPPANQCAVTPTIDILDATIIATGAGRIRVNAPANSQIEVLGYSRPDTTYRVVRRAVIDADGNPANFLITPPTNTRLYAQIVGCDTDEVRFSKVMNVRTQLSLNVERLGKQTYRFFGDSLPARRGGLIVSLYRVTDSGRQVLTSQVRANALGTANAGEYSITRTFTGTGRFGFVVRTGQDLLNAPGSSNVRSLLIF